MPVYHPRLEIQNHLAPGESVFKGGSGNPSARFRVESLAINSIIRQW